jgi:cell division protein FtsN
LGYTDDQLSIRAHTSDDRNLRTIGVEIRSRTARKPANIVPRFNPTGQEIGEVQTEDAGVEVAVKKDFLASAQKIFTVQVASYETEEQAFEVTNSVTQFGEVRVIPWDVNGKRWYRIYVGRSHSISEMKELRNRVAQALGDSQIFVKQIDKPVDKSF